jgi:hypothetical protein
MRRAAQSLAAARVAGLALLLLCALPGLAAAYAIRTDKAVYDSGETIVIQADLSGLDGADVEIESGEELYRNVSRSGEPAWYNLAGGQQLDIKLLASAVIAPLAVPDGDRDPHRVLARVVLSGTLADHRTRVSASSWITVVMRTEPRPGVLDLGGRSRIDFGESVTVNIADLPDLVAASVVERYGYGRLALQLVRLGRLLPGGAVLPDRVVGGEVDLEGLQQPVLLLSDGARRALEKAGGGDLDRTTLVYDSVGYYELRLIGRGETVLDSLAFEVAVPDAAVSLALEPPVAGAFDTSRPPLVSLVPGLDFPRLWPGWTDTLALRAQRAVPGWPVVNEASGRYLSDDLAANRPILDLAYTSGGLRPGTYRLLLDGLAGDPDLLRQARLAEATFEIGGDYPADWLPKPMQPPLAPGEVQLSLAPGREVAVGTAMTVHAAVPEAVDLGARGAWFEVAYAPEVRRYRCQIFDLVDPYVYQIGRLPAAGSAADFLAPSIPEAFEVRLFERDERGEPRLLAAAPFTTRLPALPGALHLVGTPVAGAPIALRLAIPADAFWNAYDAELWRSAQRVPGGAAQPARFLAYASQPSPDAATFQPVYVPGLYEVRLVARGTKAEPAYGAYYHEPFYVDRLAFRVDAPEAPPLPPEADFAAAPALDDWPWEGDPRRGLAAWRPAPEDCLPASPPPPASISVVEFHNGALADPADDRYVPVQRLELGRPYLVEARFAVAPSAEAYEVTLSGGRKVVVRRTSDPQLYRSDYVTLTAAEAAP